MATVFKRYRTPTGAHVTVSETFGTKRGWTELPKEAALDVNGKPRPPIQPEPVKSKKKTTGAQAADTNTSNTPEADEGGKEES
ncbi:hypothetical protein GCM10009785_26720 [Brooklawnia cerclae]|uniref:Alkylated DNA repair dioxygenase AlkB n=1 Tax=Brooklawnia cerclae TaxID=349934 RepID=A0ABX0SG23_9ACTN|nr:hypothetical protein [Brooklawnia cerclae]NIH57319.1 alkylated DNA repair dioxygenase AlkB [Brooklawnia cerclae]